MEKYLVIIIVIIIIIIILSCIYNSDIDNGIPDVKGPFINLKDENGKNINMLCIRSPLDNDDKKNEFLKYVNKGIKFIGCSSYLSFPSKCLNKYDVCRTNDNIIEGKTIEDYVLGWCHCFREPGKYIKGDIPKILISESDFNSENIEYKENVEIKYDYIIYQPKDDDDCESKWHGHNKNWILAEKCIKILSDEFGLKGIIIGRGDCPIDVKNKNNIEVTGMLKYGEFIDKISESRFMLLPNFEDPSPRVLTEALTLNKPVFVNENILGGWKYVNDKTGMFFNENNIRENVIDFIYNIDNNRYSPREYYLNNHGIKNSGKDLRDFLKEVNPDLCECELVRFNVS